MAPHNSVRPTFAGVLIILIAISSCATVAEARPVFNFTRDRGILGWLVGRLWSWHGPTAAEKREGLPRCMTGREDLNMEIRGSLEPDYSDRIDSTFDDAANFHVPYFSHAHCDAVAQPLKLVPEDCELSDFDPLEFLNLIRGRRMVFWGDSVHRQFYAYLTFRLRSHQVEDTKKVAGLQTEFERIDPEHCQFAMTGLSHGLQLSKACFNIQANVFEETQSCMHYLDGSTALCFVRTSEAVVDDHNVAFWNELTETDILFANVGLHMNARYRFRQSLAFFTRLLNYQSESGKGLPLIMWRDTSAQHFEGGKGGNFPARASEELRAVPTATFSCAEFPFKDMKKNDWRNRELRVTGFVADNIRVEIPILHIWNTTAMIAELHPRILGSRENVWSKETGVADCTHFCPTKGGIYEVWATLMQNFLEAAGDLSEGLKPRFMLEPLETVERASKKPEDSSLSLL